MLTKMERSLGALGLLLPLLLLVVWSGANLLVGALGIAHHLGGFWAFCALGAFVLFRVTFPLTIGCFFGALNVLEWHWLAAIAFTFPGLLFLFGGLTVSGVGALLRGGERSVERA